MIRQSTAKMTHASLSEAQRSVDRLFAEDFEPVWMQRQREARRRQIHVVFLGKPAKIRVHGYAYWRRQAEKAIRIQRRMERVEQKKADELKQQCDTAWRIAAAESRQLILSKRYSPPMPYL